MKKESQPRRPTTSRENILALQAQIREAVAGGANAESLTLRMTWRDEAGLRRNSELPVEAISYANGEMRFWGVKVEKGGVETSVLEGV